MPTICPTCGQRVPKPRTGIPAPTWVAAARKNSMHRISEAEGQALDRLAVTLRGLRARSGLTRAELARATGLSGDYIKDLEAGLRRPRFETVRKLAWGLRPAPLRVLVGGRVLDRCDPVFRLAWEADEGVAATDVYFELLMAVEGAIAPLRCDNPNIRRDP